jgi:hypothetical protein
MDILLSTNGEHIGVVLNWDGDTKELVRPLEEHFDSGVKAFKPFSGKEMLCSLISEEHGAELTVFFEDDTNFQVTIQRAFVYGTTKRLSL